MNAHGVRELDTPSKALESFHKSYDFKKLAVRRMKVEELDSAISLLRSKIPAARATDEAIYSVQRRNPDSIWGIYRRGEESTPGAEILGFFCMLLLTEDGARLVRADKFNTREPDVNLLVRPGERPSAIYYWAIVAEGLTIPAGPMIIIAMGDLYADVPLYVRPTTEAGLKRVQRSSYKPLVPGRDRMGDLFSMPRYPGFDELRKRLIEHEAASRARRLRPRIEVKIVSTPSEMEMALRIRAVYLIEQKCPYFEEYDGNDYCGTTFLGYVGGEPAGTLRVRYFADFVKFERMTVLPRFRTTTTVSREIVQAAITFCARKGYRKGYGHSQLHAVKFWTRFGFQPIPSNRKLVFSDHEYVEIEGEFPPHGEPITMCGDPYLILRPEGRWDEPGVLDRSSVREPTNPC